MADELLVAGSEGPAPAAAANAYASQGVGGGSLLLLARGFHRYLMAKGFHAKYLRSDEGLHGLKVCLVVSVDLPVVLKCQDRPFVSLPWAQVSEPGKVVSGELILATLNLQDQAAHHSFQLHVREGLSNPFPAVPCPFFPLGRKLAMSL